MHALQSVDERESDRAYVRSEMTEVSDLAGLISRVWMLINDSEYYECRQNLGTLFTFSLSHFPFNSLQA